MDWLRFTDMKNSDHAVQGSELFRLSALLRNLGPGIPARMPRIRRKVARIAKCRRSSVNRAKLPRVSAVRTNQEESRTGSGSAVGSPGAANEGLRIAVCRNPGEQLAR